MNSRRRISHVSEPLYGEQSIATAGTASGIRGEIPSIFFAARAAGSVQVFGRCARKSPGREDDDVI
jgi:hypothetical protein